MSITVSLPWARKLCSWNFPQRDSQFVWVHPSFAIDSEKWFILPYSPEKENLYQDNFTVRAAPTAEEILRKLPPIIEYDGTFLLFAFPHFAEEGRWMVSYEKSVYAAQEKIQAQSLWIRAKGPFHANEKTLADAAASMWCFLMENDISFPIKADA